MAGRVDLRGGFDDHAVGFNEIRDPLRHRDHGARRTRRLGEGLVPVGQELEREVVLLGPFSVGLGLVVGNTDDRDTASLEIGPAVPQLVGLQRSTTGVGLGVEEEEVWGPHEICARDSGAVVGGEFETRKGLAGL